MIVLGIDPGSISCGYAVIQATGDHIDCLECGEIKPTRSLKLLARLAVVNSRMSDIVRDHNLDAVSAEDTFMGKNVKTSMAIAQARCAALLPAARLGFEPTLYAPATVKLAVTGKGNADKDTVMVFVRSLINNIPGDLGHDASDALAIAYTHVQRSKVKSHG